MAACEMPLAAASRLKLASQGSKAAVLRQLAWPNAAVGMPMQQHRQRSPSPVASLASSLSAFASPSCRADRPGASRRAAHRRFLLVERQLAYPERGSSETRGSRPCNRTGNPAHSSKTTNFRQHHDAAAWDGTDHVGRNDHANWRLDGSDDRRGPVVRRDRPRPAAGAARAHRAVAPARLRARRSPTSRPRRSPPPPSPRRRRTTGAWPSPSSGRPASWSISRRWTARSMPRSTSRAPRRAPRCPSVVRARRSRINMPPATPRS